MGRLKDKVSGRLLSRRPCEHADCHCCHWSTDKKSTYCLFERPQHYYVLRNYEKIALIIIKHTNFIFKLFDSLFVTFLASLIIFGARAFVFVKELVYCIVTAEK